MTTPVLLSVFPSFAVGGAQSRFATIANHFGPSWRHVIVAMDGVTTARERLDASVHAEFPLLQIRKGDLLGNVRRFRAALHEFSPTTLLTHNFGSIEWAIANRRKIVPHVHVEDGFGPEERSVQLPRRVWLRRIFLRGRRVVLPSETLLQLARNVWRLDPRNLSFVPNGVDLDRFSAPDADIGSGGSAPTIGTVAALRPEKNIARLIRAVGHVAAQHPVKLVLVGDGAERPELEALTAALGLGNVVHFAGHMASPDQFLKSIDISAMSSDTEQMPISLLEAMAAGRPVAATDVGDVAAMLPQAGRPFVTPCDDAALGAALVRLVSDPLLRRDLGLANRARAIDRFDQKEMFARWSALLEGRPLARGSAAA